MFISNSTRPDIAFATNYLARYSQNPTKEACLALIKLIHYLYNTRDLKLKCHGNDVRVVGYSDSDWGGDAATGKSTSGCVVFVGGTPVCWRSRLQSELTPALSSAEAEYVALVPAAKEIRWIHMILVEIGLLEEKVTHLLLCDNMAARKMAMRSHTKKRTKHINIKVHYIREEVSNGLVSIKYVNTIANYADCLTKPITGQRLKSLRDFVLGIKTLEVNCIENEVAMSEATMCVDENGFIEGGCEVSYIVQMEL